MIYAIRAVDTEFVKIGKANSVGKRYKEIQTHCPFELEILAVARWDDRAERVIHQYLEAHWERGEWFKLTTEAWQVVEWMRAEQWQGTPLAAILPDLEHPKQDTIRPDVYQDRRLKEPKPQRPKRAAKPKDRPVTKILSPIERRQAQRAAWWKARQDTPNAAGR